MPQLALGSLLPGLRRDRAHRSHICAGTGPTLGHICTGTGCAGFQGIRPFGPGEHLCRVLRDLRLPDLDGLLFDAGKGFAWGFPRGPRGPVLKPVSCVAIMRVIMFTFVFTFRSRSAATLNEQRAAPTRRQPKRAAGHLVRHCLFPPHHGGADAVGVLRLRHGTAGPAVAARRRHGGHDPPGRKIPPPPPRRPTLTLTLTLTLTARTMILAEERMST